MPDPRPAPYKPDPEHLSLVQGVINRLAGNSFALKGWSVTLVSALLALNVAETDVRLVAIALLPALTFWGLDGYFLAQERLFRDLYGKLVKAALSEDEVRPPAFSMVTDKLTPQCWANAIFSLTLILFHGTVVAVIGIFWRSLGAAGGG
jgi:hypothetical protein